MIKVETALSQNKISGLMLLCFENERPFQGTLAHLDWRLNGHFSSLLKSQLITGKKGEVLYAPLKWNDATLHFVIVGAGSLDAHGKRPKVEPALLTSAVQQVSKLSLQNIGISESEWQLSSSEKTKLEERKICILN